MSNQKSSLITLLDKNNSQEQVYNTCKVLFDSKLLPKHIESPEIAFMIVQKGHEMGLPPIMALENLYYIQGKPTASINVLLSLAYRAGVVLETLEDYKPVIEQDKDGNKKVTDYITRIKVIRKIKDIGVVENEVSFSKREAYNLGLLEKENWVKQCPNMMWIRCASRGLRRYASDVIYNLYEFGEMADTADINYQYDENNNPLI